MKISLLGTGSVAQAIGKGLLQAGHEIRFGSRTPSTAKVPAGTLAVGQRTATEWADAVILGVPYLAVRDTIDTIGPAAFHGKIVVDATNAIGRSGELALGFTTSGAEELAKLLPGAKVVKAFNTAFAGTMAAGTVAGEKLSLFVAGDDRSAKEAVLRLASEIGFDAVDAGGLRSARYLEPMGMQLIVLGYKLGHGGRSGFRFVREK